MANTNFNIAANHDELYKTSFDNLGRPYQLLMLTSGVFFFFGLHQVLQEAIMKQPEFHNFGIILGYLEVLGVTICSFLERTLLSKEQGRVAPIRAYPLITFCLMASASLCNLSLNYINFPTKVVFRSCKLLPTMIIATLVNKKAFTGIEYGCALAICCGLICFAAADWKLSPTFNPIGITLVSLSVCADSILPNAQENLFRMGASRLEVTFYSNAFTLLAMTCTMLLSGDLLRIVNEVVMNDHNHYMTKLLILYTFTFYAAVSVFMNIVKRFGGVTAVLIATARKFMTIIISFILFPKPFSWFYAIGSVLVLGGLMLSSLIKKLNSDKKSQDTNKSNILVETQDNDATNVENVSSISFESVSASGRRSRINGIRDLGIGGKGISIV